MLHEYLIAFLQLEFSNLKFPSDLGFRISICKQNIRIIHFLNAFFLNRFFKTFLSLFLINIINML